MGRILRRTREASLASAVQNEGRHCCAAERSRPECQPAALRSRRREPGAKGPLWGDYYKPLAWRGILFFILYNERRALRARPT